MSDFSKNLPKEVLVSLGEVRSKWSDPGYEEDSVSEFDWRSRVRSKLKGGSVDDMRKAALPSIQYEIIKLAHTARSEQTQLQAAQFIMAQEGQGAVQKVEHTAVYDKMPADQLSALVMSKIAHLSKVIPNFSLDQMVQMSRQNAIQIPSSFESSVPELVDEEHGS